MVGTLNLLTQCHWDRSGDKDVKGHKWNHSLDKRSWYDSRLWKHIDRPVGDISVMDSCVVDGVACLHNTAISVKPVQKLSKLVREWPKMPIYRVLPL